MRKELLALLAAASMLTAGAACAQTAAPPSDQPLPFDRTPNSIADTPVLERAHPGYEPVGDRIGTFTLLPKLTGGEDYNDNLFAASTNAVGDFRTTLVPELTLTSDWTHDLLQAHVLGDFERYVSHPTEAVNDGHVDVSGRYDGPNYLTLSGEGDFSHLTESRSNTLSPRDVAKPIQLNVGHVQGQAAKTFFRLRLTLTTDYTDTRYQDAHTPAGVVIPESIFNTREVFVTGKAEYAISPAAGFVLSAIGNQRRFDDQPAQTVIDRNSSGYDITGGVNLDLTHVIRGQILLGYLNQTYDSPAFRPVAGPSAHVKLLYLPTGLTTVTLTFDRKVNDVQDTVASSFLSNEGRLQVDHELYRYIILSGSVDAAQDQYKGIDRSDRVIDGQFSVNYLLDRHFSIKGAYDYLNINSTGSSHIPNYVVNQISISLVAQL